MSVLSCAEVLGIPNGSIDTTVLRADLAEAYEDAQRKFDADEPSNVFVSAEMAIIRATHPSTVVKYHRRDDCSHFVTSEHHRLRLSPVYAREHNFQPCPYCAKLTLRAWCRSVNLDPSQVSQIISGHHTSIRKRVAVRLLRAIGQEPHPSLLGEAA